MTHLPRFTDKVALVTGASRGIGLAIAEQLVAEGARVALTARNAENLTAVIDTFPKGSAIGVAGNSGDDVHRADVLDRLAAEFGGLDVLVNNAGVNPVYGPLEDLDVGAARKILEVNVLGTLGWVQAVLRHETLDFRERHGTIVNISSVTGEIPSEGVGWYGVSKAAVSHLTHTLAVELGPEIRVNAIAPAVVKTKFAKALYEGKEAEITEDYPLRRLGTPEDIANAAAFLASAEASWITGQVLNLDGGLLVAGGTA